MPQNSPENGRGALLQLPAIDQLAACFVASLAGMARHEILRDSDTYLSRADLPENTLTIVSFEKPWLDSEPCADSAEK